MLPTFVGCLWMSRTPVRDQWSEETEKPMYSTEDTTLEHAGDEMLTISEVAEVVRVPVATLRYWRHLGTGPRGFRIGRSVRYWRTEVLRWLEEQSAPPAAAH